MKIDAHALRKQMMILTTTFGTVAALVVGSVAWYKMANGGNLNIDVKTNEGDAIAFTFSSYDDVDGTLSPAKMKQGVINNHYHDDYTNGLYDLLNIPHGSDVLAKTNEELSGTGKHIYDTYDLDPETNHLLPKGRYLNEPASQLYRQFSLRLGSSNTEATRSVVFSIDVDYYDVFLHDNASDKDHKLQQKDALSFSFYIFDSDVDSGTLSTISTKIGEDASSKKTISQMFYDPNGYGRYERTTDTELEKSTTYYTPSAIVNPSNNFIRSYFAYDEANDIYRITDDTSVQDDTTYYEFKEVSSPSADDIGSYYEKVVNKLYSFTQSENGYTLNTVRDAETWDQDHANEYHMIPDVDKTSDDFKMTLQVDGLEFNKTYYVMTSVYYNVPDELLDGDLWLAHKIDINLNYDFVDE